MDDRRWPGTEQGHSDAELTERVAEMLATSEEVDGADLDVRVEDGVVTLRGPLPAGARDAAERVAGSVRGVRRVEVSGESGAPPRPSS